jgi:hypothetical protein
MNAETWDGEIPAKVFDTALAIVIAGFANEDTANSVGVTAQAGPH